jgi:hypothetical protein
MPEETSPTAGSTVNSDSNNEHSSATGRPASIQSPGGAVSPASDALGGIVTIEIMSPTQNAQIAGLNPGLPLTVSGTFSSHPSPGTQIIIRDVSISIGSNTWFSWERPLTTTLWSHAGITPIGGQFIIEADIDYTLVHGQGDIDGTSSAFCTVLINATPPSLSIVSPTDYQEVSGNEQGASVSFKGTLSDPAGFGFGQNPVLRFIQPVTWSGDWSVGGIPNSGTAISPDNWATWDATIQIPPGLHTIVFTGTDIGGNQSVLAWHVKVVLPSDIFTTTQQDYLKALLEFATQEANAKDESSRITVGSAGRTATPTGKNVVYADLVETFYQPFPDLTLGYNLTKATEEVNQLRLAVEVLRKYTTAPSDPVAYWKCNEGSGSTAADSSGNALNGTLVNTSWAPGQAGRQALQFNGSNAYVQVGNPPQLKMLAAVTIAAWVNPSGPGSDATFGGIVVSKEAEYEVARDAKGNIIWAFANTQPAWNWIDTGQEIPLNQWTHIAISYDNGLVNTYVNGKLVHSYSGAGRIGSADPNNHDFRIGGRQAGLVQFFQGLIDQVQVFRRALNAREVGYISGLLTQNERLRSSEAEYRQTAYFSLLNQVGTSYDQIRLARAASQSEREALAQQLGIGLGASRPDRLDSLFRDASSITERALERIFGLADSTRNPLSQGAKISDVSQSLVEWNFDGVIPGRNTDPDGFVYATLQARTQTVTIYADPARTVKVAQGTATTPTVTGEQLLPVPLSSVGNSGLGGYLVVDFSVDASDIKVTAAPNLLAWQMQHLRSVWATEDFPISAALLAVSPNTAQPGQRNLAVTITGQFTNFMQGKSNANFGVGVSVASLTVHSPTSATAVLNIDAAAVSIARNVTVTTNLEVVTLTNGFAVAPAGTRMLIQVIPATVSAGKTNVTVAITGQATNFVQGTTTAAFGTGINLLSLTVNSPTSATALVNIDPALALGTHDVILSTGTEVVKLAGGLAVTAITQVPSPIVDPDVLSDGDFVNANTNDTAYALYVERKGIVQNWIQMLEGLRASGLDALLRSVLKDSNHLNGYTAADISLLDQTRKQGSDISPYLAALNLALDAFNYLVKVCRIASTGQLLESEWTDLYSILAQTKKVGQFVQWRAIESSPAYNLTLSPDWFALNNSMIAPPAWRATAAARLAWQAILQGRINQQQTLAQGLGAAVDVTEQTSLPSLRDALVQAIQASNSAATLDWLTERCLMNIGTNANQKTSRLDQSLSTLQNLFFTLRNEGFQNIPELSTWSLNRDAPSFDTEWTWMGTYSGWQAVINVFLFPQTMLFPYVREGSNLTPPTQAFKDPSNALPDMLTEVVNAAPLSPHEARRIAADYLANLQNHVSLSPSLPTELKDPTLVLSDQIADADLAARRDQLKTWWNKYDSDPNRKAYLNYLSEIFYFVPLHLALQLQQGGQFTAALDWYHTVYAYRLPVAEERKIWYGLVAEEAIATTYDQSPSWLLDSLNPHDVVGFGAKAGASGRALAYTRFTLLSLTQCFLAFADSEFSTNSQESIANATNLYLAALNLLSSPELAKNPAEDNVPQNELLHSLAQHAKLNLEKIRNGRNIAGVPEQPVIGAAAGPVSLVPTQYSYQALIDRAKQLVGLAQQVESSFLGVLEKADAELYNELKAKQDLQVANQNTTLQGLMVTEAQDSVRLAQDQQARAQIQVGHYNDLINSDIGQLEQDSVYFMSAQAGLQGASAALYTAAAIASGFSPEGIFSFGSISASTAAEAASSLAQAAGSTASALSAQANFEEKQKDWQFQLDMANQDVLIAGRQIQIANDHADVVSQHQTIANTQAKNAQNTLDFLTKEKFTNAVLYQWMSGILQGVYSYFLQQATTIARLAQNQLAFERQQPLLNVIQADYWQPPSAGPSSSTGGASSRQPSDTKGLTGAERLLQDVYELDQYAFATNQRKLQITKTISLAELDPFTFQLFTETGVLRFAMPGELFDADFPGHYLRLIQQVRLSVIALIPPTQGVRATLWNTGVSRLTIENDGTFSEIVVRRDPQEIALSAPLNATGVFQLDPQQALLPPFQGLGVDTSWELKMPKAANPIDYSTIADVIVVIDYTALDSPDYRRQVIQGLSRSFGADRGYSFKQQFADAWYELNNPEQSSTPMVVQFTTMADDFPPNLNNLQILQVLLHFVPKDGASFQVSVKDFQFTPAASQIGIDVGPVGPTSGTISTRRGNAANWVQLIGQSPFGQWQLSLPDDDPKDPTAPRNLIANGQITDILFAISYSGQTPAWPT